MTYIQLYNGFRKIWDRTYNNNSDFSDINIIAEEWSDLFKEYYKSMKLPINGENNNMLIYGLSNFRISFLLSIKKNSIIKDLSNIIIALHSNIVEGVNIYGYTTNVSRILDLSSSFSKNNANEICKSLASKIDSYIHKTVSIDIKSKAILFWS